MNVSGLLPPIKHRLTTAVQNFPVIPPITAVKASVSRSQSRGQGHDDEVREDVSEADTAETRESIKKRNTHLLKVNIGLCFMLLCLTLCFLFHCRFTSPPWRSCWSCS